ncbi:MAG: type II toxin-antitoxin system Phd/YefM family antitoxin [Acidimicrobiales bacterium]
MTTGAVTKTREHLSEILETVASTDEEYVITKHGRPVAVVLSYDEYEAIVETLNVLSDEDAMDALAEAQEDVAEGRIDEVQ